MKRVILLGISPKCMSTPYCTVPPVTFSNSDEIHEASRSLHIIFQFVCHTNYNFIAYRNDKLMNHKVTCLLIGLESCVFHEILPFL